MCQNLYAKNRPVNKTMTPPKPAITSSLSQAEPEPEASKAALADKTLLTPATSAETRDAIDALLLLGELLPVNQIPDDDNSMLVPIVGYNVPETGGEQPEGIPPPGPPAPEKDAADEAPTEDNQAVGNDKAPAIPLLGTVLGTAIKADVDVQTSTADKTDSNPITTPVKKKLSIKQYGIKRKYKQTRMFKCKLCPAKLPSVQDYNKHYLNQHPPQPCPDCTRVFISPRTLAKHRYTHAEYMYECEDCNRGFTFKSQLESHRKVHLKMSGFVCFKPKYGKRFKRESELNYPLNST